MLNSGTYIVRADLKWDPLEDGSLLLRWEGKAQVVAPQRATAMLAFLEKFDTTFELEDIHNFEGLQDPMSHLLQNELIQRREEAMGDRVDPGWYNHNVDNIPYPKLSFMNHGYAELDDSDDFSWLREEDKHQVYQHNMIRYLLNGEDLTDARVLDVGCGRGGSASYMARYHDTAEVFGLDFSKGNIDFCDRVHTQDKMTFVHGDAQDLPFEDNYFDVVTNIESSHCYGARNLFYRGVHRVLKTGGVFCYTDCCTVPTRRFKIERYMDSIGFIMERSENLTDRVIHALELGGETLAQLMHDAVEDTPASAEAARNWLSGIQQQYNHYTEGRVAYELWNFRKS